MTSTNKTFGVLTVCTKSPMKENSDNTFWITADRFMLVFCSSMCRKTVDANTPTWSSSRLGNNEVRIHSLWMAVTQWVCMSLPTTNVWPGKCLPLRKAACLGVLNCMLSCCMLLSSSLHVVWSHNRTPVNRTTAFIHCILYRNRQIFLNRPLLMLLSFPLTRHCKKHRGLAFVSWCCHCLYTWVGECIVCVR